LRKDEGWFDFRFAYWEGEADSIFDFRFWVEYWEGEAPAEPRLQKCKALMQADQGITGSSPPRPNRRHPTHGVRIHLGRPTIVFVTVCTKDRHPWLATPGHHALLRRVWAEAKAWLMGRYVVMPDHIHFFAAPGEGDLPLDNWVRYWKSRFTKEHLCCNGTWETDYWDRQLRDIESYDEKWEYVRSNPVRHGLVTKVEDWPYQGEIHALDWR
jgi:putative transposase